MKFILALSLCLASFSTAAPIASTSNSVVGLWLQKKDAKELRATGKLESMCEEINNDGDIVSNALNIKKNGQVSIYTEDPSNRDRILVGSLNFNNLVLTVGPMFQDDFETSMMQLTFDGTLLKFPPQFNVMIYLRSNATELNAYYQAQRNCFN